MEFFIDRRSDSCARVPFENKITVEFDGLSEPIEADCVDLSTGGISLRTALLPDEGTPVFCSFEGVVEAADFGVWGRVVWVQNQGTRSSEFGVCFHNLDPEVEVRISELLSENAHSIQRPLEANPQPKTVKLLFDGSASPVEAYVVGRSQDHFIFAQDLELLRIKRGLLAYESHENSYRGRIASVDLRLEGQVPRLLISVKQDPIGSDRSVEPDVQTQAIDEGIDRERCDDEIHWNAGPEPAVDSPRCTENEPTSSQTDPPKRSDDHCTLFTLPEDGVKDETPDSDLYDERDVVSSPFATGVKCLTAIGAVLWSRLQTLVIQLFDSANKLLRESGKRSISRANERMQNTLIPSIKTFAQKLIALRLFRRKRRTTAASSPLTFSGGKSSKFDKRSKWFRLLRPVILPGLAIGGVALAVYGFNPWTESGRVPLHRPVQIETTEQQSVPLRDDADMRLDEQNSTSTFESSRVSSQNPTTSVESGMDPNAVLKPAVAESNGQKPGHTSSRHDERKTSNGLSSTMSTASSDDSPTKPIVSQVVEKTPGIPTFGSRIKVAGQHYTLRMSNEITELRGIPETGGFTVIIPGSLSFDRAGPIAATHPLVSRSAILNKGDHSALTVRFARGKSPAYRVTAKGSSLEITIAEKS